MSKCLTCNFPVGERDLTNSKLKDICQCENPSIFLCSECQKMTPTLGHLHNDDETSIWICLACFNDKILEKRLKNPK